MWSRSIGVIGVVVAVALSPAFGPFGAPVGATPIDDAKATVAASQQAADGAAARYEAAVEGLEELAARIEELQGQIATGKAEVATLRASARERAVRAYVGRDALGPGTFVLDDSDPLDQIRRDKLLAKTKAREDADARRLQVLTEELDRQRLELEQRKLEQEAVVAEVEVEQVAVQAQLQEAQRALDALEEQLRQELAAAAAREAAAAAAREASSRAGNGRDYSGSVVATGIVCPIRGALSFIDSWGYPRHQGPHKGVDLMAASGTPNVAVVSGNVTFKQGGTSGMGAYLQGDDGHLYYYFHLSAYEGGPRRVAQGE
ncbi:MAG: hypothetical protein R6X23_00605, partial [Acidimicrobiia bacterium]